MWCAPCEMPSATSTPPLSGATAEEKAAEARTSSCTLGPRRSMQSLQVAL